PVGTLCNELAKLDHFAHPRAGEVFTLLRDCLAREFARLGRTADADTLAMQLLVQSQGVATLASAFRDETFVRGEVARMHAWLDAQDRPIPAA
ncbi:MAG: TetR/AcrR family transcriptional regulator, partial [Bosea sp.]|nr:TetR/AcrR family transcriptional regulator [Bosea sp. (in: a-proteobacteria)]